MSLINKSESILVLDTNILLDLARLPLLSSKHFLSLLESVQDRLWIPRQVYEEFKNNKYKVFGETSKRYDKLKTNLLLKKQKFITDVDSILNEPKKKKYIDINKWQKSIVNKINEIDKIIEAYGVVEDDKIKSGEYDNLRKELDNFVSGLEIGEEILLQEKIQILSEGEIRYKYEIPPGFKDAQKEKRKGETTGQEKFGDLFIWKEILNIPNKKIFNNKTDIIFITNDQKIDWFKDNKIHPVLLQEFKEKWKGLNITFMTGAEFYKECSKISKKFESETFANIYRLQYNLWTPSNRKVIGEYIKNRVENDDNGYEYLKYVDFTIINEEIKRQSYENDQLSFVFEIEIKIEVVVFDFDKNNNPITDIKFYQAKVFLLSTLEYDKNNQKFKNNKLTFNNFFVLIE